ncbi:MAG: sugar phosphate nucleotidyltransferase [Brevinematia bacterium]
MKVLILCGGKGKTLWPISRDNVPKQFSKTIFSQSLFQKTLELWREVVPSEDIFAIAPEEFRFFVKSQSIEVFRTSPVNYIPEKDSKGTLKAVAMGILFLTQREVSDSETVIVCNSDQVWRVTLEEFHKTVYHLIDNLPPGKVLCVASSRSKHLKDKIETEGVKGSAFRKFVKFSRASNLSNVGVYISYLGTFRRIIQETLVRSIESIIEEESFNNVAFEEVIAKSSENVLVYNWDIEVVDIDNISDVSILIDKDQNGNFFSGDVVIANARDVTAISTKRFVAIEGVSSLNVIETPDVVYVCSKNSDRSLLELIRDRNEVKYSTTEYRPWGSYTVIERGANYQIKRIVVNPGESLSLQLHYHRSEHWVVVKGTAKVTVEDKVIFLRENESTFIPKTAKHRLENPGKVPLEIIEIQIGEYISEDDIVRFLDIYGRSE